MNDNYPAQEYLTSMDAVNGWCQAGAAVLIMAMHLHQQHTGITGHLLEIGVYQGKSGILLCNLTQDENERCLLVDSLDVSDMPEVYGVGNLDVLQDNIARFAAHIKGQVIVENMSSEYIMEKYSTWKGRVRIAHVDGEHTYTAALRDLQACADLCRADGCIILDDAFNPNQPGVNQALNEFVESSDYVVFAIGYNKAFLCHKSNYQSYSAFDDRDETRLVLDRYGIHVQERQQLFHRYPVKLCYDSPRNISRPSLAFRAVSRIYHAMSRWEKRRQCP